MGNTVALLRVDFDNLAITGSAEANAVVIDTEPGAEFVEASAEFVADTQVRIIEKSADGLPEKPSAGEENVGGDGKGDQRVKSFPAGDHDQDEAGEHAEAGPTVGEDVFAVGFEDEGVVAAADAQQVNAQYGIERACGDDQDGAPAEMFERRAVPPFLGSGVNDGYGGKDDHAAFKAGREEIDALVAVLEARDGGAAAEPQAENGESHGDHVDNGFGGVREDG